MDQKRLKFQKLTPADDIDLKVYRDALDFAFSDDEIKNIAISGQYGAGKSSLLETYKKENDKKNFVHISLAHFNNRLLQDNENDSLRDQENDEKIKESILEGKILNQLIHQTSPEKIPQSNFKVKKNTGLAKNTLTTILSLFFIIAIIYNIFYNKIAIYSFSLDNDIFAKIFITYLLNPYCRLITWGIIIAYLYWFIFKFIRFQSKNILKKISLQGNEIEILEESKDSYFDKYLNEVLYLFENIGVDAIVFEDLDRFDKSHKIFQRLREINTLANIQIKKEKRILRFIYLLRDDIFTSKDRTKFFDFIIPVIPVITSANSYDQLLVYLLENKLHNKLEPRFLKRLSYYIDEMRILKNICNEFLIYAEKLDNIELDYNKLFALISYKNIFPKDFSNLQVNQGLVYTIFNMKNYFISHEIKIMKERAAILKRNIEDSKVIIVDNESDLDFLYNHKKNEFLEKSRRIYGYNCENNPKFIAAKNEIENKYKDLKEAVKIKEQNLQAIKEDELVNLEKEISALKNSRLQDIIKRDNIDAIFQISSKSEAGIEDHFLDVKNNNYFDLLKYLIRNGYIDESYFDYMTYFYENSLSNGDKIFLRSITDKKAKDYSYKLKDPQLITEQLEVIDFMQIEILNFDLLSHLLENSDLHSEKLDCFVDLLKDNNDLKFISLYLDLEINVKDFVRRLNTRWAGVFTAMLQESAFPQRLIKQFSVNTLYYSDDATLKRIDRNYVLSGYISKDPNYLDIGQPDIEKIIAGLKLLNVKFVDINYDVVDKDLFTQAYENFRYLLNYKNICTILQNVYGFIDEDDIRAKNYTLIISNPDSPLSRYVHANFDLYVGLVLANCDEKILDDEAAILKLINNDALLTEKRNIYVKYLMSTITLVTDIHDHTLWDSMFQKKNVRYSEVNIFAYFKYKKEINDILIEFINSNESELDFSTLTDQEEKEKFFTIASEKNQLTNEKYHQILNTLGYAYTKSFEIENLSDEKFHILVDDDLIYMTSDSLAFIRKKYSNNNLLYYIKKNIDEYANLIDDEIFDIEELKVILEWDIDDEIKLKLLKYARDELSVINKKYSMFIIEYILDCNFNSADIVDLVLNFDDYPKTIQNRIINLSIENIEYISDKLEFFPISFLNDLFSTVKLDIDKRISLFLNYIPYISEQNICKNFFSKLELH